MRVFIAIELPNEIKAALTALQDELRQTRADVTWTRPDNFHLTIKFLGEVEANQLPNITNACVDAAASVSSFMLQVKETGVFPNVKHPKVLWAGMAGELDQLQALHRTLDANLHALGFAKEARSFNPHLTLGRVKSLKNIAAVTAKLLLAELPAWSFSVAELVVMQSQLHPAGSIYTPLAHCPLGKD
ncbi:MAG TPA: RNA 2',3'-cyclic phosphodiesterase [Blastocatellia bacterium]|nr:RNA 2',3'-cyclic phosphodiesterase [Blastocatellia bacterium]